MAAHRRHLLPCVAVAAALALVGTVAVSPAAMAAAGVTTSLPARTTSVPAADEVSGSGQAVVWRQKTAADTRDHGWLSLSGGAPQDLGPLADTAESVSVDAVSVQDSVVAVATSTNPNGALADHVTLRRLDTGSQETLAVAYDSSGAPGAERYRGQAGDGILVQQAYYNDDSQYRVRLVLRTSAADRTLLSGDNQYEVLASDADGALVRRRTAPSWDHRIVYVDFATGATVTVAEPSTGELPQGLEFTPTRFGVIDGAKLTEWQRAAPADGPATVTLPTDKARWISDDTLAWYEWTADGNELYAMPRDGSTAAADLNGTFWDISVGDDGRMRTSLYRPDVDAAIQTLTDGRVSTAADDATTIPAGPARLDALALSGGTLYTADDSSRRTGVLLSSALTVGPAGASAATPSRVLAYSTGTVHRTLAAAGNRVLVEQGNAYQVYENGKLTGVPLEPSDTSVDQVVDFDGAHFLLSDKTTSTSGTLVLHTVATGADRRVPAGSALYGGGLYSSVQTSTSSWSIRRTDLATAAVTTVTTVDCRPGDLQVRGSWILLTTCGAAPSSQGLLLKTGTTTRTTVDASVRAPVLGTNLLYTFTKETSGGVTLNAQVLGVTGAAIQPLFALPSKTTSLSAERWAVDREAPWATWMDDDGATHIVWAGAPSPTAASAPTGFSPNGDGKADTWAPKWTYNRPVTWTLVLKSSTTSVRTLTGTASGDAIAPVWNGRTDAGTAAAEGSYTWTLSVRDVVTGVPAAGVSGKVTLRRTAPAASVTVPTLASNSSTSAVIPVSWTAKTAGVTSYDVGWKVTTRSSTGVWTLGPLQTWRTRTTSKSAVFGSSGSPVTPKPGLTYRFYVRAHDDAGQTGAWSAAAAGGIPVDDRSSALTYKGTWASKSVTSAWSKTERASATPGATVSFTADGTKLRIVATATSNGGRFAVIVDGTTVGTVNTYTSATSYRKVVFTYTLGTKITTHKAQLKVLSGTTAARATVHLDAIMVTR
ncbi:fibronectin type III domain-containing protein [Streptomyces sp. DSM 40750]|uniref:fibronectin type III domain-containing protein n=1 Tax=Streptomyces sp. DSM 40750 TaxID=2801030 RepID=UPI00214CC1C7|nr:fibronectin type III domain-containing protein [Streptomyces sp. DSM 40750]UUU23967.1 hypothetical protein JIX55_28955 [Streptomyces sp. DSM 40750]